MKPILRSAGLLAVCASTTLGQVVLNEIRINDPDTDDFEYAELFNRSGSAINLDTISYVVIGTGGGGSGVVRLVVDLPAVFLGPGEHFVLSGVPMLRMDPDSDGVANLTAVPDLVRALQFEDTTTVTHLLAVEFSASVNADLDTDDDGILDVRPWIAVSDAVSLYSPESDSLAYAMAIRATFENVGPDGNSVPAHAFRVPDGGAWIVGALGQEQNPGDGNLLQGTADTPGVANPTVAPLGLSLSASSVSEGAPSPALTGTVTRPGNSGEVALMVTIDDESEAVVPEPVTLLAGESTVVFNIDVINDRFPDGPQTVTVTVSAMDFSAAQGTFVVTDDDDSFVLVFNEVYYANDPVAGDVNGDSIADEADHFIEIVNVGTVSVDLSDYRIEDESGTALNPDGIHRFPQGTVLAPGCALVVFGGPGAPTGSTTAFGTAEIQISSSGGLSLDETGETLRLLDSSGIEVYLVELPDLTSGPENSSLNLVSEGVGGDPSLGYDLHVDLAAGNGNYSPGIDLDLDPFCTLTESLSIVLLDATLLTPLASIPEAAAPGSVVARVGAPTREPGEVVGFRIESVTGELLVTGDGRGTLDDANPTVDVLLNPVDNSLVQGSRIETIRASASNYLNTVAEIEVTDDGDLPPFIELVINEVDADQAGTDSQEFIELYNLTDLDRMMDGLVLVLINGNGDVAYGIIDLAGFTIPARGFFVVGHADVPNVDLVPPNLSIQNGADAVAIYQGTPADFELGAEVGGIANTLIDAVVYDTGDVDDEELLAALTPGQPQINEDARGAAQTDSIQRVPDGGAPLETGTYLTRSPTPGATNKEEQLVDLVFDFDNSLLVATFSGLKPGVTYSLEASVDGGGTDPFVPVTSFTSADRNVIDAGGGEFIVSVIDGFLADLAANPTQVYRLTKP